MKVFFSDQSSNIEEIESAIFLAGPTPRSDDYPSWRPEALGILETLEREQGQTLTVLVPERRNWQTKFDYTDQTEWELNGLLNCKKIVFWVPRVVGPMNGLTTNVEFGYMLGRRTTSVYYGRPDDADSIRYLDWLFHKLTGRNHINSLTELLRKVTSNENLVNG